MGSFESMLSLIIRFMVGVTNDTNREGCFTEGAADRNPGLYATAICDASKARKANQAAIRRWVMPSAPRFIRWNKVKMGVVAGRENASSSQDKTHGQGIAFNPPCADVAP